MAAIDTLICRSRATASRQGHGSDGRVATRLLGQIHFARPHAVTWIAFVAGEGGIALSETWNPSILCVGSAIQPLKSGLQLPLFACACAMRYGSVMALVVSSAGVSGAASMRNAIIGRFLDEARSISLPTCEDAVALSDNISTKALAPLTARAIASAYRAPAFYVTRRDPARHSVSF